MHELHSRRCPQQHHDPLGATLQQGWNVCCLKIGVYILFTWKTQSRLRVPSGKGIVFLGIVRMTLE